jgi:hypothetical protein
MGFSNNKCQNGPVRMVSLFEEAPGTKTRNSEHGATLVLETRLYDSDGRRLEVTTYDTKVAGRIYQKVVYTYASSQKTEEVQGANGGDFGEESISL